MSLIVEEQDVVYLATRSKQVMDRYAARFTAKQTKNCRCPGIICEDPRKCTTTKTGPSLLMSLAPELHLMVAGNLEPLDRVSLKLVNHHFHRAIPPFAPQELSRAQNQLYKRRGPSCQAIPGTNIGNGKDPYLACVSCMRLRPSMEFADEQQRCSPVLRVPRRLTRDIHVKSYSTSPRFCISCGIQDCRIGHKQGDIINVNQREVVVCNFCNSYGWNGEVHTRRRAAGLCNGCWRALEATRGTADKGRACQVNDKDEEDCEDEAGRPTTIAGAYV